MSMFRCSIFPSLISEYFHSNLMPVRKETCDTLLNNYIYVNKYYISNFTSLSERFFFFGFNGASLSNAWISSESLVIRVKVDSFQTSWKTTKAIHFIWCTYKAYGKWRICFTRCLEKDRYFNFCRRNSI